MNTSSIKNNPNTFSPVPTGKCAGCNQEFNLHGDPRNPGWAANERRSARNLKIPAHYQPDPSDRRKQIKCSGSDQPPKEGTIK